MKFECLNIDMYRANGHSPMIDASWRTKDWMEFIFVITEELASILNGRYLPEFLTTFGTMLCRIECLLFGNDLIQSFVMIRMNEIIQY